MSYLQITIQTTQDIAESMADALMSLDALSVALLDASDEPLFQIEPEDNPLWSSINVRALFPENSSPREIINTLKAMLSIQETIVYKIEKLADQDWVRLTQQHFQPQCHGGHLWVCPSWDKQAHQNDTVVQIDPGLAFGTGTHETTALCLEWLATNDIQDKTVIDYGCGSGILSISAVALGAKTVYATDHDPQAIEATQNNAKLNTYCNIDNLIVTQDGITRGTKAEIIIANILANPLITLAETITQYAIPSTQLILSGILSHEVTAVAQAYTPLWTITDITEQGEWQRISFCQESNGVA